VSANEANRGGGLRAGEVDAGSQDPTGPVSSNARSESRRLALTLIISNTDRRQEGERLTVMNFPDSLIESVGFVLSKVAQRVVRLAEAKMAALGIQTKHVGVLATIVERGPLSQKAVGEALLIDRTTMVQLADRLESLALVERRPDPVDRRVSLLHLTADGETVYRRARSLVREAEAELLDCLSAEDRRKLHRMLVRVLEQE
jgi:DNA-binding MarR family transcriptional regulator